MKTTQKLSSIKLVTCDITLHHYRTSLVDVMEGYTLLTSPMPVGQCWWTFTPNSGTMSCWDSLKYPSTFCRLSRVQQSHMALWYITWLELLKQNIMHFIYIWSPTVSLWNQDISLMKTHSIHVSMLHVHTICLLFYFHSYRQILHWREYPSVGWGHYDVIIRTKLHTSNINRQLWPDFRKPSMYTHSWISRNTNLKYSKYYSFLMLDGSHIRFALEIE